MNAWPLDEGLIDYVAPSYGKSSDQNPLYTLNIIANAKLRVGAKMVDATTIDAALLRQLQQAEGVQTNVSTGKARAELLAKGNDGALAEILTGLGSLTFGEMAGERMKLGLMLHDPEEQQDCFSNNTHNSHYYDEIGIAGLWRGRYVRLDGSIVEGTSMRDYVTATDPAAAQRLDTAIDTARGAITAMRDAAESKRMAYSQMIASGNAEGNKLVQSAMDALVAQTRAIEGVATVLHLMVASNKSDHSGAGAAALH